MDALRDAVRGEVSTVQVEGCTLKTTRDSCYKQTGCSWTGDGCAATYSPDGVIVDAATSFYEKRVQHLFRLYGQKTILKYPAHSKIASAVLKIMKHWDELADKKTRPPSISADGTAQFVDSNTGLAVVPRDVARSNMVARITALDIVSANELRLELSQEGATSFNVQAKISPSNHGKGYFGTMLLCEIAAAMQQSDELKQYFKNVGQMTLLTEGLDRAMTLANLPSQINSGLLSQEPDPVGASQLPMSQENLSKIHTKKQSKKKSKKKSKKSKKSKKKSRKSRR